MLSSNKASGRGTGGEGLSLLQGVGYSGFDHAPASIWVHKLDSCSLFSFLGRGEEVTELGLDVGQPGSECDWGA